MAGALEGLAVVVTGAGGGLGREYALACAEAGALVVVNDVHADAATETARVIQSLGGTAVVEVVSVVDAGAGDRLVEACLSAFGRIDGLVNNAGLLGPGDPCEQDPAEVAQLLETNIAGVIRCGTAAMRAMARAGRGSIVNVVSGAMQGLPNLSLYGGTKGAVMGLTYGWALEMAEFGVRVNAISPLAATGMSDLMDIDDAAKGGPAHRVAPAVVYLLSGGSAQLNGQILRFDGTRLGLVAPPRAVATIHRDQWDVAAVTDAVAGPLSSWLSPVGLAAAAPPVSL